MENRNVAGFPSDSEGRYQLYLWATAIVCSYSFSLGEDSFQAMVSHGCPVSLLLYLSQQLLLVLKFMMLKQMFPRLTGFVLPTHM